jgi:subtilisin family serine protease
VRSFIVTATTQSAARSLARTERRRGVQITQQYRNVLAGFSARLTQADVRRLRAQSSVRRVDVDRLLSTVQVERRASATGLWGLDRIDQRGLPLDGRIVTAGQGQGVAVYVLDTGIRFDQTQFAGRISTGHAVVGNDHGNGDCNGHGTSVAGVIGGEITGVAPQVTLVPVRILGCSATGYSSSLIAGLDWIVQDHEEGVPAVANISMYGPRMDPVNAAIARTVADGVVVSTAAGNDGANACDGSPASAPDAITSGATTPSDTMAEWSGWGECVDLLAPGDRVLTAAPAPTGLVTAGGTSIAAAFTSGAAAIQLGLSPFMTPADVAVALGSTATPNAIRGLAPGTPNRLLYIGVPLDPASTPAAVAPPGPEVFSGVTVSFRRAAHTRASLGRYTVAGRTTHGGQLTLTVAGRAIDLRPVGAGRFAYRTRVGNRISVVRLVVRPFDRTLTTSSLRVRVRFPA